MEARGKFVAESFPRDQQAHHPDVHYLGQPHESKI